jgi:hypothetical protein
MTSMCSGTTPVAAGGGRGALQPAALERFIELARGTPLPLEGEGGGRAARALAAAFPTAPPIRGELVHTALARAASPLLRRMVDDQILRPNDAVELCRLDHAAQDDIVRLGKRCALYVAREIRKACRLEEQRKVDARHDGRNE